MRFKPMIVLLVMQFGALCRAQSATTAPAAIEPNSSGIIVGPDTTLLSGPLLADGSVDYVAALNAIERQGITSENNAACVLMRITEADLNTPADGLRRAEILRILGLQIKPGDEIPWQSWNGFQHPPPTDHPQNPANVDRFALAEEQPWSDNDIPEIAAWLKSNEKALAIAAAASRRQRYWVPLVLRPDDSADLSLQIAEPSIWANFKDALCIRCMQKLHQGDTSGALEDLLVEQRLGTLLGQSPQAVTLSVGTAFRAVACQSSWRLFQYSQIPANQLRQWSASLIALGPIPLPPRQMWQRTRYDFLYAVQNFAAIETKELLKHLNADDLRIARSTLKDTKLPVLDWNRILRLGNMFFDDLEKNRSLLPIKQRELEEKALDGRFKKFEQIADAAHLATAGNPPKWLFPLAGDTRDAYCDRVGAIILVILTPALGRISETIRRSNEQLDWTAKVGVALAVFREERGEYPGKLENLIPSYLARLPDNTSPYPVSYERRDAGYVIRNIKNYSSQEAAELSRLGWDYDRADIIIRTDGRE